MKNTDAQLIVSACGRAIRKLFDPLRLNLATLTEKLTHAESIIAQQRETIEKLTIEFASTTGRFTERCQQMEAVILSLKNAELRVPSVDEIAERIKTPPPSDTQIKQIAEIVIKELRELPIEIILERTKQIVPTAEEIAKHVVLPKVPAAEDIAKLISMPTVPTMESIVEIVRQEVPTMEQVKQLIAEGIPAPEQIAKHVIVPDAQAIVTEVQRSIQIPIVPTPEQVAAAMPAPATAEEVLKLVPIETIVSRVRDHLPTAQDVLKLITLPNLPTAEEIAKLVVVPSAVEIAKLVPLPELPTLELPELPEVPTLDDIMVRVKELLPSLIPAPIKGDPGTSITVNDVRPLIEELIKSLPKPADGKSLTIEDVRPLFAQWVLEFERRAVDRHDQILAQLPKPKDGRDGLGFEDVTMSIDLDAKQLLVIFKREGVESKCFSMFVPFLVHRGVYRAETKYLQGDCVTRGGSTWMAVKSEPSGEPSDGKSLDWRLIVKRGNDGRDYKDPSAPPRIRIPPR